MKTSKRVSEVWSEHDFQQSVIKGDLFRKKCRWSYGTYSLLIACGCCIFVYSFINQQIATVSFVLKNFVAAPSFELLNLAKKTNLLDIADHYALTSMLKHEIKNILIKFLVDQEILDPSALASVLITQTDCSCENLEVQRPIQLVRI